MRFVAVLLLAVSLFSSADARCRGKDLLRNASPAFLAQLDKATARHPFSKGRYWEVSKNGKTSWIIGTIHLEDRRTKDVPKFFARKLRTARLLQKELTQVLSFKINLADVQKREETKKKKQPSVSRFFTDAEWRVIVRAGRESDVAEKDMHKQSPKSIRNFLSAPACAQQGKYYLDRKVELEARKYGVPVQPLDSIKSRLALRYAAPYGDRYYINAAKGLIPRQRQGADRTETTVQMYRRDETMKIWQYQILTARQYLSAADMRKYEQETYGELIIKRNRLWMPKILPELHKGNVVIAVGALHLPGKHGLVYQLQQKGFSVKRLQF